ncbi:transcriptional regulator CadC, partial [Rhizobiaceae sp. 2RAB30]
PVMPIVAEGDDRQGDAMAGGVTDRLIEGLAKIDNIRVVVPPASTAPESELAPAFSGQSEFVLQGELQKDQRSWTLQARLIKTATGEVRSVATVSVAADHLGVQLQQSRLAAGAGHQFATSINTFLEAQAEPVATGGGTPPGSGKVVIEQAIASINQTTRERFATAQAMLEKALAGEPDDVDLQVALAALQTRGIQLTWYGPDERAAAEASARSLLERALRVRPRSIPVLEAYCRFLTATNNFAESLVACARALS